MDDATRRGMCVLRAAVKVLSAAPKGGARRARGVAPAYPVRSFAYLVRIFRRAFSAFGIASCLSRLRNAVTNGGAEVCGHAEVGPACTRGAYLSFRGRAGSGADCG